MIIVLFLIFCVKVRSDEDFEGYFKLVVEHTLDEGFDPTYTRRGVISINSLKTSKADMFHEASLSQDDVSRLRELSSNNGIYRIRVAKMNDDGSLSAYVHSFTKACSMLEAGLKDSLTINLDGSGSLIGVFLNTGVKYCDGGRWLGKQKTSFESSVDVQVTLPGPMPDTESYIRKIELEKQQAMGQNTDNRSFLAKYWMYIVPFLILLMIVNNSDQGTAQRQ